MCQRGLAQARRTVEQHVVERLAAQLRRLDEDLEILQHLVLTGELVERLGADHLFEFALFIGKLLPGIEIFSHNTANVVNNTKLINNIFKKLFPGISYPVETVDKFRAKRYP